MKVKLQLLVSICLLLSACGTLTIEKRLYRKGLHISWNKKVPVSRNEYVFKQLDKSTEKIHSKAVTSTSEEIPSLFEKKNDSTLKPVSTEQIYQEEARSTYHTQAIALKQSKSVTKKNNLVQQQVNVQQRQFFDFSNWWLFSILIVPFVIYRKAHHQKLARWAQKNVIKTRILLVFSSILAAGLSLFIGHSLSFQYAPLVAVFSALGVVSGIAFYKNSSQERNFEHQRNKRLLGLNLINVSAYLSFFGLGGSHVFTDKSAFLSWNKMQFFMDSTPSDRVHSTGVTVALVIAAILVLLIIAFITVVSACYLSCTGFNVLAVVVGIVGFFLATYLSGLLFLYAYKKTTDEKGKIAKRALWVPLFALAFSIVVGGLIYFISWVI
ncbi:MAG: hypothetical protein IT221_02250 [Fluviicola sp.]|nr:hypothetical protein [Fluviicola sp.]